MLIKYGLLLLLILNSCTTLTSTLHTKDKIDRSVLKRGKSCSKNLFGGFTLPYFKDTTINMSGSHSIITAINNGGIDKPVVIDNYKKHYVFYSKICTIIYGE